MPEVFNFVLCKIGYIHKAVSERWCLFVCQRLYEVSSVNFLSWKSLFCDVYLKQYLSIAVKG